RAGQAGAGGAGVRLGRADPGRAGEDPARDRPSPVRRDARGRGGRRGVPDRSADVTRIPTTHVGSLPRPQEVVDLVFAEDRGEPVDRDEYERVVRDAVADRVRRQLEAGVDIVSDGEMSKIGYATYVRHRLSGYEVGDVPRATPA